jgi:hypothetical protein
MVPAEKKQYVTLMLLKSSMSTIPIKHRNAVFSTNPHASWEGEHF